MKVLIACECSGVVCNAFRANNHEAWSCDLRNSRNPYHIVGDVLSILNDEWDMMIAHPPCTYLARCGSRHFKARQVEQQEAIQFVKQLYNCAIPKVAIENPVGVLSSKWKQAHQVIQPWMFGHNENKKTCLWLKGLDPLQPTEVVEGLHNRVYDMSYTLMRSNLRSITYDGIAKAMADQWGPSLRSEQVKGDVCLSA
jgi:hypothetical protein